MSILKKILGRSDRPDVDKLQAENNSKELRKALKYEQDAAVRASAASALGNIESDTKSRVQTLKSGLLKQSLEASIVRSEDMLADALLNDSNVAVRLEAVNQLGRLGQEDQFVDLFVAALQQEEDAGVRKAILACLGKAADPRAIEALGELAANDSDESVREEAKRTLQQISGDSATG
jgi:HEAT repeat protein